MQYTVERPRYAQANHAPPIFKKIENNNNDIIKWNGLKQYEKHIGCTKIFL